MPPLVFHPIYSRLSLPDKHRFPIDKYLGIRNRLGELGVPNDAFSLPEQVDVDYLKTVLDHKYIDDLTQNRPRPKCHAQDRFSLV